MKRFRVRAPELRASGPWLNTPAPLTLAELRGRLVLLDFWTSGCVNCLHVLDELRPLEARYPLDLVVIGVHSPKFAHESTQASVAAATARYGVAHPVLSDPELALWKQYAVRAWPTLVLIDQQGYVVAQAAGEGQVSSLEMVIDELLGTTSRTANQPTADTTAADTAADDDDDDQPTAPPASAGPLFFPAKVIELPPERTGRVRPSLLIANAGGHSLVEVDPGWAPPSEGLLRTIGSGQRGRRDGNCADAEFAEPNGLALLPVGVARYDVLVADTANHLLRGVRLSDGAVVATIDLAAQLADARTITGPVPAVLSPWDVCWWPALNRVVVAAAGVHLLLLVDPVSGATDILAGTTVEGLGDGAALDGWLAQPSGLAVDGRRLWFVDAETSSLRYLQLGDGLPGPVDLGGNADAPGPGSPGASAQLHTAVGAGLFDFGYRDGPAATARLQHPLGVTRLPDGSLAIMDTYNGAIRRYDPATDEVSTLATGLAEPSGAVLIDPGPAPVLLVVESAAHRLIPIAVPAPGSASTATADGTSLHTVREPTIVGPGPLQLRVLFEAPPGRKLDDRDGPATRLSVSASPPALLAAGAGDGAQLHRTLELAGGVGSAVLQVSAQAASCDDDPAIANPACHLARQDWGIPLTITADGPHELDLVLFG